MKKILAIGWTLVILGLCSIPGRSLPGVSLFEFDKVAHFGIFFVFAVFWMWALRMSLQKRILAVMASGIAYAVLTEIYQGLLPFERTPDVYDALANSLGLMVGVASYSYWERRHKR